MLSAGAVKEHMGSGAEKGGLLPQCHHSELRVKAGASSAGEAATSLAGRLEETTRARRWGNTQSPQSHGRVTDAIVTAVLLSVLPHRHELIPLRNSGFIARLASCHMAR